MRYERLAYLNTGTKEVPVWSLLGKGFEEVDDKLNPEVDEPQYVADKTKSSTITAYAPEWGISGAVIKDDPAITYCRAIGEQLATGEAAESELVVLDIWDADETTGVVAGAQKYPVTILMDSIGGGKGGEKLGFSGTIKGNGDPVSVNFNTTSKTIAA